MFVRFLDLEDEFQPGKNVLALWPLKYTPVS